MPGQYAIMHDMGKDPRVYEPPGIEHIFPDPPEELLITLIVHDWRGDIPVPDRHWTIAWLVGRTPSGCPIHRRLEVVRERGPQGLLPHLTNWGPKTRSATVAIISSMTGMKGEGDVPMTTHIPIAPLSLGQRKSLEEIAADEPVMIPNGWWNCQHWVVSVLGKAVGKGIFCHQEVIQALETAGWTSGLDL